MNAQLETERQLIKDVSQFTWNPLGHAEYCYPWGKKGHALENEKIRDWQREDLAELALHLSNPATRHEPFLMARSSGHGIGKSALIGMISKWAMDTCDDTRVVITANTEGQLRNKTSPEVSKWFRWAITSHWFQINTTSIHAKGKHEKSWRLDFIPWSQQNTEAFAGLHNKGKRILIIMDEGSAIIDDIWEVIEGALTDADTEIIWIVFGNPTRNIGRFRECFRKYAKYWSHRKIDSRTVEGTNKKLFERWAEQYGEDSDFYRVRVRGEFPNASVRQFYPTDLVEKAQACVLKRSQFSFAPTIISVDPSWTGDDAFVIGMRQGLMFRILEVIPKNDNDILMANKIARYEDEYKADAVFIDGGYGTGIVSAGRTMNRNWTLVWFGEKSIRLDCFNKRAEMLVNVLDWLKEGGSIPEDDSDLYEELLAMETVPTMDGKFKFPPKEDFKEIIGRSPNRLDCLAISFAYPVMTKTQPTDLDGLLALQGGKEDRDPLDAIDPGMVRSQGRDYDPLDKI